MQKFTQKYTLITLLEKMNEGAEFSSANWPLHVTIADTFAIDRIDNDLYDDLSQSLHKHPIATAIAAHDEYFGGQKQIQVTILDMSSDLIALHNDVIDLLQSKGAIFNDPQYTKDGFKAHATVQPHARLKNGDVVHVRNLTLIDMFPGGDPYRRRVIKTLQ